MMPILGTPILVHLMRIFAAQGLKHFVLAAGHRQEILVDYFTNRLSDWQIEIVDTGADSDTGERIRRCAPIVGGRFIATYGDGVGNVDLRTLLAEHEKGGLLATVTTVRMRSQYGTVQFDEQGFVTSFQEKPVIDSVWINAGFFVFEPGVFSAWHGSNLESHVLPRLATLRQLHVYKHPGFWKSMDTTKDQKELEELAGGGGPPWLDLRNCATEVPCDCVAPGERISMLDWSESNVLVTGATGFVGGWLVKELLRRNARVVALVRDHAPQSTFEKENLRNRITVVSGCLEDPNSSRRACVEYEIDTVFHLAAQSIVGAAYKDRTAALRANVMGTWNVLEAARNAGVKQVVIASSDKAYGNNAELPYLESHPLRGLYPYDVSKSCADLISSMYAHTYGMKVAVTRCANIFGGGDLNFNRLIPGVVLATIRGERFVIRSDGRFARDFIYIKDVVNAYLLTAQALAEKTIAGGEALNFSLRRVCPFWRWCSGCLC